MFDDVRFANERVFTPRISAVESEKEFVITAELPGVDPTDLDVVVEDGLLTIKGERRLGSPENEVAADEEQETAGAGKPARRPGEFHRRFRFNSEIDEDAVKARYKDGLLTVTVPKAQPPEPEVRTIPVQVA